MQRQPFVGRADAELIERLTEVSLLVVVVPREREWHGDAVDRQRGIGIDPVSKRGLPLRDAGDGVERGV